MTLSWKIPVVGVGIILGITILLFTTSFGIYNTPPATNVALTQNPICSIRSENCVFILENAGSPCKLLNITLYQHGDTTVNQTIVDEPWGLISSVSFNSILAASSNQIETIPLPSSLENGAVVYYQVDFVAESMFGSVTVVP
jgi:hypothetical protein